MEKKTIVIIIFLSLIGLVFAINEGTISQWSQIGDTLYSIYAIIISHPITFNNNVTFNDNVTFNGVVNGLDYQNYTQVNDSITQALLTTYIFNSFYAKDSSGSITGGLTALYYERDGLTVNLTEATGSNPLILNVTFNLTPFNVTTFNQMIIREYYLGSASHNVLVQLWDYNISAWETYTSFIGQSGYNTLVIAVTDANIHIQDGIVKARFFHQESGNPAHLLSVDTFVLVKGFSSASSVPSSYDDIWLRNNLSAYNGNATSIKLGWNLTSNTNRTILLGNNHKVTTGNNLTLLGTGCDGLAQYPVQICNGNNAVYIPKLFSDTYQGGTWSGTIIEVTTTGYIANLEVTKNLTMSNTDGCIIMESGKICSNTTNIWIEND